MHRSAAAASRAIELALRGETFQVSDIQQGVSQSPSRQTIYRVLEQLQQDGWIENQGKIWKPGTKATILGEPPEKSPGFDLSADDIL